MKQVVARILAIQFAIGASGALVWGIIQGWYALLAALLGALINMFLVVYVAVKLSSRCRSSRPRQIVITLYRAEAMKLLIAALLVSAAVILFPGQAVPLVSVFAASALGYWFALLGAVRI